MALALGVLQPVREACRSDGKGTHSALGAPRGSLRADRALCLGSYQSDGRQFCPLEVPCLTRETPPVPRGLPVRWKRSPYPCDWEDRTLPCSGSIRGSDGAWRETSHPCCLGQVLPHPHWARPGLPQPAERSQASCWRGRVGPWRVGTGRAWDPYSLLTDPQRPRPWHG